MCVRSPSALFYRGKFVTPLTAVPNHSNSLPLYSSRPGRPPKRASVSLSLAASHLAAQAAGHHAHQLKKHRMDNGDYYENGHLGEFLTYAYHPSYLCFYYYYRHLLLYTPFPRVYVYGKWCRYFREDWRSGSVLWGYALLLLRSCWYLRGLFNIIRKLRFFNSFWIINFSSFQIGTFHIYKNNKKLPICQNTTFLNSI